MYLLLSCSFITISNHIEIDDNLVNIFITTDSCNLLNVDHVLVHDWMTQLLNSRYFNLNLIN